MQASPAVTDGEETLYGLLRQNFPYNLGRLLRSSVTRLKVAIEAAADDGVIATSIGDDAQARAEAADRDALLAPYLLEVGERG